MTSFNFEIARKNMILGQLAPHGIHEDLQTVFEKVPRELFVSPGQAATVYSDSDTPILDLSSSSTRHMLSPIKLARFFKAIPKTEATKVLCIGCGSGYSLALGYEYGFAMYGIEDDPILVNMARDSLQRYFEMFHNTTQIDNYITLEQSDLKQGLPQHSFYDAILIEGGVESVPHNLLEQLTQNGRLMCIHLNTPLGVISVQKNGIMTPIHFEKTSALEPFKTQLEFVL